MYLRAFVFLLLLTLVLSQGKGKGGKDKNKGKGKGKDKPKPKKEGCDKDFKDCKEPEKCMKNAMDPAGGLFCLEIQAISSACPCTCMLILDCDKILTTPKPTTPKPTKPPTKKPKASKAPPPKDTPLFPQAPKTCFSGDSHVITSEGRKPLRDIAGRRDLLVEVLDEATLEVRMGKIWFWNHVERETETEFLKIKMKGGRSIELTPEHVAITVPCSAGRDGMTSKFAKRLRVGECMLVKNGARWAKAEPIVEIQKIDNLGIYSFMSETGNVLVDGVVSSCYNNYENTDVQRFFYGSLHAVLSWLPDSVHDTVVGHFVNPAPFFDVADVYCTRKQ